jgi:hypothetical protein
MCNAAERSFSTSPDHPPDFGTEVEGGEGVKQDDRVILTSPVGLEAGSKVQIGATGTAS